MKTDYNAILNDIIASSPVPVIREWTLPFAQKYPRVLESYVKGNEASLYNSQAFFVPLEKNLSKEYSLPERFILLPPEGDSIDLIGTILHEIGHALHDQANCYCAFLSDKLMAETHAEMYALHRCLASRVLEPVLDQKYQTIKSTLLLNRLGLYLEHSGRVYSLAAEDIKRTRLWALICKTHKSGSFLRTWRHLPTAQKVLEEIEPVLRIGIVSAVADITLRYISLIWKKKFFLPFLHKLWKRCLFRLQCKRLVAARDRILASTRTKIVHQHYMSFVHDNMKHFSPKSKLWLRCIYKPGASFPSGCFTVNREEAKRLNLPRTFAVVGNSGNVLHEIADLLHSTGAIACFESHCGCMSTEDDPDSDYHALQHSLRYALVNRLNPVVEYILHNTKENAKGKDYYAKSAQKLMQTKLWALACKRQKWYRKTASCFINLYKRVH